MGFSFSSVYQAARSDDSWTYDRVNEQTAEGK